MYYDSDEGPYRSKFHSYSFQLLDDRMKKRRNDQWKRFRFIYLLALFLIFGFTFGWEASQKFFTFLRYKAPFLVQGCFCNDENFCFTGLNETGSPEYGKPFDCSLYSDLKQLNLLSSSITENPIKNDGFKRPIVITTIDAGSYSKLEEFIGNVSRFYDNSTIVIYDLGMEQGQIDKMKEKWCDMVIERINKTNYKHKPLLGIQSLVLIDAFTRYKFFIYLRPDLKIHQPFMENFVNNFISNQVPGIFSIKLESNKISGLTSSKEYLPIDNVFQLEKYEQTVGFFVSNSEFSRKAFKWLHLCLHTKECIKFVDPLENNHLDITSQILWQYTTSQFFGKKHLAYKMGYVNEELIHLTPDNINAILQRHHNKVSTLYRPFSI